MTTANRLLLGIAVMFMIGFFNQSRKYAEAEQRNRASLLRVDSLEAEIDTQRVYTLNQVTYYARRIVQSEQERDKLSRLLSTERKAKYDLIVQVAALRDSLKSRGTLVDSTCTEDCDIEFSFEESDEGYTLTADVIVSMKDTTAELQYEVLLRPIPLSMRVECGTSGTIKRAYATITSVDYVAVTLGSLSQSPDVCNPIKPQMTVRQKVTWAAVGAGILYGAARTANFLFK